MSNLHYDALLTPDQLILLRSWLAATGELYVRLEFPHGGGSGCTYLMRRLAELRRLLADQTHPELELFVYRDLQFPLRGTANETMLQRAMELVPDGSWYSVVSLESYYPAALDYLAGGSSPRSRSAPRCPATGVGASSPSDVPPPSRSRAAISQASSVSATTPPP